MHCICGAQQNSFIFAIQIIRSKIFFVQQTQCADRGMLGFLLYGDIVFVIYLLVTFTTQVVM